MSEVAASSELSGEILIDRTIAGSMPRRTSISLVASRTENIRMRVPYVVNEGCVSVKGDLRSHWLSQGTCHLLSDP